MRHTEYRRYVLAYRESYRILAYRKMKFCIGPSVASLFELFTRIFARWRAEALLALTTMAACSQHVELRAAYAPRMQDKWDV